MLGSPTKRHERWQHHEVVGVMLVVDDGGGPVAQFRWPWTDHEFDEKVRGERLQHSFVKRVRVAFMIKSTGGVYATTRRLRQRNNHPGAIHPSPDATQTPEGPLKMHLPALEQE